MGVLNLRALALLLLSASVAGCGDGGVSSTPGPVASTTAAFPLTNAATFQPIVSRIRYYSGASVLTANPVASGTDASFSYNATTDTYSVQDTYSGQTISASFGPADKTTTSDYAIAYSRSSGGVTDTLKLYGNARSGTAGTAPIQLGYTSFGFWTETGGATTANTFVLFGQPTTASGVPTTGTVSYQTLVAARELDKGGVPLSDTNVTGTATFSANFASGTVATTLGLSGRNFNGAGTISGSNFSGALNSGTTSVGQFIGGFFGPAAQEMGYGFRVSLFNPDPLAGATVTPAEIYLTGVVVGAKQ